MTNLTSGTRQVRIGVQLGARTERSVLWTETMKELNHESNECHVSGWAQRDHSAGVQWCDDLESRDAHTFD
jgi:hypothetical protein